MKSPFRGISDHRVLPLLKDLPCHYGGMNVPAPDGRFLFDLIGKRSLKRGLEIGTSNGYSSLWLALALRQNSGRLITIEVEPQRAREARENFRKAGLDGVIDARVNDAFLELDLLEGLFDFVFIDAWKSDYFRYLKAVLPRVEIGGAIAAHNVISQSEKMKDFLAEVQTHRQLETKIFETSPEGISVSIKKS